MMTPTRALEIAASLLYFVGIVSGDEHCNGIQPGDIMISAFNMDDPDEVLFVLVERIDEGSVFFVTDRAWDGTDFVNMTGDGTLQWTFNQALPQSGEICYKCTQDGSVFDLFEPVASDNANYTFSLSNTGDTIFVYCMTEPDDSGTSSIRFINAVTNTLSGWVTNATAFDDGSSVLPADLPADTVTTLNNSFANYEYDGRQAGTASQIRAGLSDAQYWDGSEGHIDNLQTKVSFKIVDDDSGASSDLRFDRGVVAFAFLCHFFHSFLN